MYSAEAPEDGPYDQDGMMISLTHTCKKIDTHTHTHTQCPEDGI